jgi:hypothetical protein
MKLIQFFIFLLAQAMAKDDELAQAVQGKVSTRLPKFAILDNSRKCYLYFKMLKCFLRKWAGHFTA